MTLPLRSRTTRDRLALESTGVTDGGRRGRCVFATLGTRNQRQRIPTAVTLHTFGCGSARTRDQHAIAPRCNARRHGLPAMALAAGQALRRLSAAAAVQLTRDVTISRSCGRLGTESNGANVGVYNTVTMNKSGRGAGHAEANTTLRRRLHIHDCISQHRCTVRRSH